MGFTCKWTGIVVVCGVLFGGATSCFHPSTQYSDLVRAASQSMAPPESPPALSSAITGSAPSADLFSGLTELTIDALREEVVRRNPTLAAMRAAWRAAIERYPQLTALDDPQFGYGLAPGTIGSTTVDFGQKYDLSQRFPWPGKLSTRGEVALREAEAAGEDMETIRLRLIEATQEAFFDYYYVLRAIEINGINKRLLLEFKKIADTRYAAGLANKQDALQAEIAHQELVHRGIVLERMRQVTVARINTLLDRLPQAFLPPAPTKIPDPMPVPPIERLQAAAMEQRPELRSLALKVKAREADVHLAELEYFPSLTVTGTYNSLWQEKDLRTLVGVGLNIPIELDRRRAALDEAHAQVQRAHALLEEQRASVAFEVTQATDELTEDIHVVRLYATSIIPASEEGLAAARSGYEASTNDFLTLIDAERKLMLAQLNYYQGLAEYHKARARLDRAIGVSLENLEVAQ